MSHLWQDLFSTWKSRMSFLYGKDCMTDCKFIMGEGEDKLEIRLHKMVLGSCSTEFFNLWFMCEAIDVDEVVIHDVTREALQAFVFYLYNETVELNLKIVWDVLKLAKRYGVRSLINFCGPFLVKIVDSSNYLLILDKISNYELDDVEDQCLYFWSGVDNYVEIFSKFSTISKNVLKKLILFNDFIESPIQVYKVLDLWAEKQCEMKQIEISTENKTLALGNFRHVVKFNKMSIEEFKSIDNNKLFLTNIERLAVYRNISLKSVRRKIDMIDVMTPDDIIGRIEDINDSSIYFFGNYYYKLCGFYIFGKTKINVESISFSLKYKKDNNFLIEDKVQMEYNGTPQKYLISFKTAISLKDVDYKLCIKGLDSGERFCGSSLKAIFSGGYLIRGLQMKLLKKYIE